MSLKGILEFALHIKKFRNIDLVEPGFYHIRFTVTQETNKKKTPVKLYAISEQHPNGSKETKPIKHFIRPQALQTTDTYVTKTFNVSLCEEEVLFNEACSFRVDFNAFPKTENTCYYLEVDLMFLDFPKFGELKGSEESKLAAFHRITGFKARIRNPEKGIHEYLPVIFDQRHSCVLNITLHTSVLSLRMKTDSDALHMQPDQEFNAKEQYLYEQTKYLKKLLYKKTAGSIEALDRFYTEYVGIMRDSFQKQLEFLALLLEIYLSEHNADELMRILDGSPSKDKIIRLMSQGKNQENTSRSTSRSNSIRSEPEENKLSESGKLSEIMNVRDPDMIIFAIAQEMINLSANSLHTWRLLNEVMLDSPRSVMWHLQKTYNNKLKTSFDEKLCQKIYRTSDLVLNFEQNIGEAHNQTAVSKRTSLSKQSPGICLQKV